MAQVALQAPPAALRSAAPRAPHRALGRLAPGAALIGLIGLATLLLPLVVPYSPDAQSIGQRLMPPSAEHWLGTDAFGRDVVSRLLAGGRISLAVGILSMLVTVVLGVLVGASAGYFGGRVDALLMRLTELIMVFPTFFLIILIVASFGGSVELLILVIGLTSWPIGARIVRGEVLKTRRRDFVLAAESLGARASWIIARHILPNIVSVIIVSATVRLGANILVEAGLSYLGLGVQPPTASWGNMVSAGAQVIRTEWWLTAIPSLAIFLAVLGFNLLGEALRDVIEPRSRLDRGARA